MSPIIKRVRFRTDPIDGEGMNRIAQATIKSVDARLGKAFTVRDTPAPALSPKYAIFKSKKGLQAIRNWFLSGLTRSSIAVIVSNPNRAIIGSINPIGDARIGWNNRRSPQFGLSPSDQAVLRDAVLQERNVGRTTK
jgi:hypothetical protein